MQKLAVSYQLMAISALVLLVFYPTQFGEICLVDDLGALSSVFSNDTVTLREIFLPRNMDGGYYRPLIGVSYLLDKKLWFLQHQIMHFEGVLAHLFNGILVFYICQAAIRLENKQHMHYLPFCSALLFTLHPITTESVNWLSGRTDVMMGTFILVSTLSYLYFIRKRSKIALFVAVISLFLALLAKEAAFGFLMGAPLLVLYHPVDGSRHDRGPFDWRLYLGYCAATFLIALFMGGYWLITALVVAYGIHLKFNSLSADIGLSSVVNVKKLVLLAVSVFISVGLFFLLRQIVFLSSVKKISQTVTLIFADTSYALSIFFGAIGFYVKKFFLPLPLNFFILEIDPLYDFLGIAVLLLVVYCMHKRTLAAIFCLLGFCLLLPALPFAFGTIAWTAYAERYIYLSTAFWVIGGCLLVGEWSAANQSTLRYLTITLVFASLTASFFTFKRNQVWTTNVALLENTVSQNPKIRKLRNIYIAALVEKGLMDEALDQYHEASSLIPSPDFDEQAELMIAVSLSKMKRYDSALCLYKKALDRNPKNNPKKTASILQATILLLREMQHDQMLATKNYTADLKKLEFEYLAEHYRLTQNSQLFSAGLKAATRDNDCMAAKQYLIAAKTVISPISNNGNISLEQLKYELNSCTNH